MDSKRIHSTTLHIRRDVDSNLSRFHYIDQPYAYVTTTAQDNAQAPH